MNSTWRCRILSAVLLLLAAASSPAQTAPPAPADTVLLHGKIYTLAGKTPWAEALGIRDGKIIAAGSDSEIEKLRGPQTVVLDAQGRLVLPGFTDSHIHFLSGSFSLGHVNLDDTSSVAQIQQRLREYAAAHPGTGWVLGRGWVYSSFGKDALPHKKYIDEIFPDRPVLLECYDGHTQWANSKALALAGITRDTPNPPNGIIVRDPQTGEATGTLKEAAGQLVENVLPKPTREEELAALREGIRWANRNGLTRVHSAGGDFEVLDLYDELRHAGALTLRFTIAYFQDPPELRPQDIEAIEAARKKFHDDWIDTDAVKFMVDGVVEAHTAAMLEPYSDDPSVKGKLFWDPEKYNAAVAELDKRGLQIFTHAIGDLGVRTALDAYENAEAVNHTSGRRPRIEHIETVAVSDIPRFGKLGVIASMQPLHSYYNDNIQFVWSRNAGVERTSRAWSWGSIAKAGGRYTFGSDWPVVTLDPWIGLQTAVTRQNIEGQPKGGFGPAQRLSLPDAIRGYTLDAAYAGRREKTEGSLEPGKLADLIILSQNLFEIDAHKIYKTKVLLTMVNGKVVYQEDAK